MAPWNKYPPPVVLIEPSHMGREIALYVNLNGKVFRRSGGVSWSHAMSPDATIEKMLLTQFRLRVAALLADIQWAAENGKIPQHPAPEFGGPPVDMHDDLPARLQARITLLEELLREVEYHGSTGGYDPEECCHFCGALLYGEKIHSYQFPPNTQYLPEPHKPDCRLHLALSATSL